MNKYPKIAVIGPGVMGEAVIAGLLRTQVTVCDHINASGPLLERGEELRQLYQINPFKDNQLAVENADAVILSVKPQQLPAVLNDLHGLINKNAVVISVIAGASLNMLGSGLNHKSLIRSMPNTAAQIGESVTVWTDSSDVTESQLRLAKQIFEALGGEVYVDDESYLDMATALSGTGPAYVFLFMEAMIDAGVHLGFPRRISEELVYHTLRGSVDYFISKKEHPAALRNDVTSPGGTSAAALYYLEKAGFRTAISRAIWAAYERSQELGKGKQGSDPEKKVF